MNGFWDWALRVILVLVGAGMGWFLRRIDTKLDRAQTKDRCAAEVNRLVAAMRELRAGVRAYVGVNQAFQCQADLMVDKKHSIQARYTDEQLRHVRERYPTTMPSEVAWQLLEEVRGRDADLAAVAKQKQVDTQEFKRSAKAWLDATIESLAALAAGLGLGLTAP